jgi:hypothetical protein
LYIFAKDTTKVFILTFHRCEFLEFIPNTGDHCPGVSKKDHYYCIYGDTTHATWFCTCVEKGIAEVDEFVFHCADELHTVADIKALEASSATPGVTVDPQPGDAIDWSIPFPQWWHDIKDQYKLREVRK